MQSFSSKGTSSWYISWRGSSHASPPPALQHRPHLSTYQCAHLLHLQEGPMPRHSSTRTITPPPVVHLSAQICGETLRGAPGHALLKQIYPRLAQPVHLPAHPFCASSEGANTTSSFHQFPKQTHSSTIDHLFDDARSYFTSTPTPPFKV